jgi:CubicO group peptidase (beta-lactamase class C family)
VRGLRAIRLVLALAVGCGSALAVTTSEAASAQQAAAQAGPSASAQQRSAIVDIAQNALNTMQLNAVILRVTVNGKPIVTQALGSSVPGVPATTSMHFPNGAVAFSYLSTLLMEFVDEHKVTLDDPVGRWMPDLPEAGQVTLKMLVNNTSGYPDYEQNPTFVAEQYANPLRQWTVDERLALAFASPMLYPPGTNWSYAHTNMMILGVILSKIGGKPLETLLSQKVLGPLGLHNTVASQTASIPNPALHAFSSERRVTFGIPPSVPFYEETTSWAPSWGTPPGATETTTIDDLTKTAQGIGSGVLLSKASYQAQTGPHLLGFGQTTPQCPTCHQMIDYYNYGLGIVRSGSWLLQNPLLDGYAAVEAYLPAKKIAIAVATTFGPGAFDAQGNYPNAGDAIFRQIGAYLAPDDPPPSAPKS